MSCGGAITLARLDTAYEIRVNWFTGRVEIVSP
jgi:general secretion pathway protein H